MGKITSYKLRGSKAFAISKAHTGCEDWSGED